MRIVLVEWLDSYGGSGWQSRESALADRPSHPWTIGVLAKDEPEAITLIPTGDTVVGNVLGHIVIPRGCIKRIRTLRIVPQRILPKPSEAFSDPFTASGQNTTTESG